MRVGAGPVRKPIRLGRCWAGTGNIPDESGNERASAPKLWMNERRLRVVDMLAPIFVFVADETTALLANHDFVEEILPMITPLKKGEQGKEGATCAQRERSHKRSV